MMKRRGWVWVLGVVILTLLVSVGYSEEPALTGGGQVGEQAPEPSAVAFSAPDTLPAPAGPWHTYIWESMPAEWLQDSSKTVILEAYQDNDWKPFFITGKFELDAAGYLLLERLATLQQDAIDPRPYQLEDLRCRLAKIAALRGSVEGLDQRCLEPLAGAPDAAALSRPAAPGSGTEARPAASPASVAPPDPASIALRESSCRDLFRETSAVDVKLAHSLIEFVKEMNPFARELQGRVLLGQYPMDQFLKELEPPALQYQVLLQALGRYERLAAAQGRQQRLIPSQKLSVGAAGNVVRDLQQRLQEEDCYHGKLTGHFDEATRQAVQRFQIIHNLQPDGTVGPATRDWLNVSFQAKAELIAQAVRLHRQSETRRFEKFIWVNIPQFTLEYRKEGKVKAVHRVIVGKAGGKKIRVQGRWVGENQTPTLASSIQQVVFNPRWTIPERIRMELNGAIEADPTYLSRNGYIERLSSRYRTGEPLLVQMPGPRNPLGRVRFDFPNAYAVYMHDTPNRGLFNRSRRDFSHGCIRVDKAHQLARELLEDDQNPAASKTDAFLGTYRETFLRLNEPVPIVIEYLPVVVNGRGELVFCGDPYDWFQARTERKS